MKIPWPPLQVIVPSSERLSDFIAKIEFVLEKGIRWIQYRGKDTPKKSQYRDCLILRRLTKRYNALFIVNDYIDLSLAVDADGVHLGQDDIPLNIAKKIFSGIIGISTHSLEEAIRAERGGATYIGFGPIFPTKTKDAGEPKGPSQIMEIKKYIKIPLVAIGGIKADNLIAVFKNGADAVAVSSGIIEGDIKENVKNLLMKLQGLEDGPNL